MEEPTDRERIAQRNAARARLRECLDVEYMLTTFDADRNQGGDSFSPPSPKMGRAALLARLEIESALEAYLATFDERDWQSVLERTGAY